MLNQDLAAEPDQHHASERVQPLAVAARVIMLALVAALTLIATKDPAQLGWIALLAVAVVVVELIAISWIRYRYMDTPFLSAAFQVMVGGALVFLAGIMIGSS